MNRTSIDWTDWSWNPVVGCLEGCWYCYGRKRAKRKYHSGGLWSNTCCGHQRFGESLEKSAHRRLKEEMRFDCPLEKKFTFTYKIKFDNGLTESEYDHVFIGYFDGEPRPDPKEVSEWKWISLEELKLAIWKTPDDFTYWFKHCMDNRSFMI